MRLAFITLSLLSATLAAPAYDVTKPTDVSTNTTYTLYPRQQTGRLDKSEPGFIAICSKPKGVDCIGFSARPCRELKEFAPQLYKNIHSLGVAPNTACLLWTEGCRKGHGIEVTNMFVENLAWVRQDLGGFHDKVSALQCEKSSGKPAILLADRYA